MFGLFRPKQKILSRRETKQIVHRIQDIEAKTSGELRIYIEGECPYETPMLRAVEVFDHLGMRKTHLRNAVLLYIATESRQFAIYGDEAIFQKAGENYWQEKAATMRTAFQQKKYADGIEQCLAAIGSSMIAYFPASGIRKNELPDDIVFGTFN